MIEKVLKAYWTAIRDDDPPYTHSHAKLLDGCGLKDELNDEQLRFIAMMIPMNIEARYPQYKKELANKLNKETCKYILEQTKQLYTWILQKL